MLVFYSIFISSVFLHRHIPDAADDQTSSLFNDKLNLFPIITKQLDACTLRGLREGGERKSSFCISRRGFVISNMVYTYPSIWYNSRWKINFKNRCFVMWLISYLNSKFCATELMKSVSGLIVKLKSQLYLLIWISFIIHWSKIHFQNKLGLSVSLCFGVLGEGGGVAEGSKSR